MRSTHHWRLPSWKPPPNDLCPRTSRVASAATVSKPRATMVLDVPAGRVQGPASRPPAGQVGPLLAPSGGTDWPAGFPAPTPPVPCCPDMGLIDTADGLPQPPEEFSEKPIRYFDGTAQLMTTDLRSDGFGKTWGF